MLLQFKWAHYVNSDLCYPCTILVAIRVFSEEEDWVSVGVAIRSFIHQWLYSPLLGPGLFFSFVISFTQTVGFLGPGFSPSQGRYLHTGQHKHGINAHTDIHALNGIRTHDPSVRGSEDSSCGDRIT
jgi:hypothetical protein